MAVAPGHDVVVIGASAGGVEALVELIGSLHDSHTTSLFIVLHLPAGSASLLPQILARAGSLPVSAAVDGEPIEPGHVYVCPPDHHLLLADETVRLTRGPKENGHRPAIDTLFRSASVAYGPRVIAVVLSGMLDDGTLGSLEVKWRGGTTVAQDPNEALFSSMPISVIENVGPTYVLPVREIAALLEAGNGDDRKRAGASGMASDREDVTVEQQEVQYPDSPEREGTPSVYSCPDCGGTLWEMDGGGILHFRCRVGHGYAPDSLADAQSRALDGALWAALRALDEKIALSRRLRNRAADRGQELAERRFAADTVEAEHGARVLRQLLHSGEESHEAHALPAQTPNS